MIAENQSDNVAEIQAQEIQSETEKNEEKYLQLKKLLESVELGKYFDVLRKEEITVDILGNRGKILLHYLLLTMLTNYYHKKKAEMSHIELKELSISAYGHRHKLLRAAKLQVQGPQQIIIQGNFYNCNITDKITSGL